MKVDIKPLNSHAILSEITMTLFNYTLKTRCVENNFSFVLIFSELQTHAACSAALSLPFHPLEGNVFILEKNKKCPRRFTHGVSPEPTF